MSSCNFSDSLTGRRAAATALDWPLSQHEKRSCAMLLYQREVESADQMLRKQDAVVGALQEKISELRRKSYGSSTATISISRCSVDSQSVDGDTAHESQVSTVTLEPLEVRSEQFVTSHDNPQRYHLHCRSLPRDRLRRRLERFFASGRARNHGGDAHRLASDFSGERTPELWATLAVESKVPPYVAVRYLAETQDLFAPVQWSEGEVPDRVREVLDLVAADRESGRDSQAERLLEALPGNLDTVRALAFGGFPESLRFDVWCAMLIGPNNLDATEYSCLRRRARHGEDDAVRQLRLDIAEEAKVAWRGQPFMNEPGVLSAVTTVALAAVLQRGRPARGCCEIAALLFFVMKGSREIETVELEVFFCLVRVFEELGDEEDGARMMKHADRVHSLIRVYDPALAELLTIRGIAIMPALRLGSALCTKAGFTLRDCAKLWDTMLTDVKRFEFCDCIVVAILVCCRRKLFAHRGDAGLLAEALLAAPRHLAVDSILRTAHAVSAFQRRCGAGSPVPFPVTQRLQSDRLRRSRGSVSRASFGLASSAVGAVSSLWGKVVGAGTGALEAVSCSTLGSVKEPQDKQCSVRTV